MLSLIGPVSLLAMWARGQPVAPTFMLYRLTGSTLGRRGRAGAGTGTGTGVASVIGLCGDETASPVVEVAGVVEGVGEASWEEPRDDEDTRWDTSLVVWPLAASWGEARLLRRRRLWRKEGIAVRSRNAKSKERRGNCEPQMGVLGYHGWAQQRWLGRERLRKRNGDA